MNPLFTYILVQNIKMSNFNAENFNVTINLYIKLAENSELSHLQVNDKAAVNNKELVFADSLNEITDVSTEKIDGRRKRKNQRKIAFNQEKTQLIKNKKVINTYLHFDVFI